MKRFLALAFIAISHTLFATAPFIIGIAGGTGSGKSTLSKRLQTTLGIKVTLIEQDCYYKDLAHLPIHERELTNFDHPSSIDFDKLYEDVSMLKQGKPINKPSYSFKTHCRESGTTPVQAGDVIIVEGILIFTDERLRNLFDLKIYVEAEDDVRILRRIERDILERGRDLGGVIDQYLTTVKPMHKLFVEPCISYADVIIPGESDTSSVVKLILAGLHQLTFDRKTACG
ncbi:MAG: uridine kinase [Verrucomicrobia bacterium]|nr:uridine kinase [Verrucomicrobiota bacterium]MBS0637422.1 uridine kinase [Verrucomicrobiota bacterium]